MTLEILLSCMHQNDHSLVNKSGITGNVLMINQCDTQSDVSISTEKGIGRIISTTQRGLTKSRNLAISQSKADICLLCDDDEVFEKDYEDTILRSYQELPQADVIIFKMTNRTPSFPDKVMRLKFPKTMKVSSWQISFRREKLLESGIRFDELLGAGTGNGAEEELRFLLDCQKAGLNIYYVPRCIASVGQTESTWFQGFDVQFFENRGATTRYILGFWLASVYAVYYVVRKRSLYRNSISSWDALKAILRGIRCNKISKQAK